MGKLTLKDGKFYRGGTEVKAEFGNKEQIALLNQVRKRLENGVTLGKLAHEEVKCYIPTVRFNCLSCGKLSVFKLDSEPTEFKSDLTDFQLEEVDVFCKYCKQDYKLIYDSSKSKRNFTLTPHQKTEENL